MGESINYQLILVMVLLPTFYSTPPPPTMAPTRSPLPHTSTKQITLHGSPRDHRVKAKSDGDTGYLYVLYSTGPLLLLTLVGCIYYKMNVRATSYHRSLHDLRQRLEQGMINYNPPAYDTALTQPKPEVIPFSTLPSYEEACPSSSISPSSPPPYSAIETSQGNHNSECVEEPDSVNQNISDAPRSQTHSVISMSEAETSESHVSMTDTRNSSSAPQPEPDIMHIPNEGVSEEERVKESVTIGKYEENIEAGSTSMAGCVNNGCTIEIEDEEIEDNASVTHVGGRSPSIRKE